MKLHKAWLTDGKDKLLKKKTAFKGRKNNSWQQHPPIVSTVSKVCHKCQSCHDSGSCRRLLCTREAQQCCTFAHFYLRTWQTWEKSSDFTLKTTCVAPVWPDKKKRCTLHLLDLIFSPTSKHQSCWFHRVRQVRGEGWESLDLTECYPLTVLINQRMKTSK